MPITSSTEQRLAAIVGSGNLRVATEADRVANLLPRFVVEPGTEQELAVALAFANEAGLSVIPRGGGTKLDWGNPPRSADLLLSTARLNRILEHAWADLTVTVEAGCTLQFLQETLSKHGQRLAFDGLWPHRATIGGVLSTNDSGALRLRFGALRDLVIGVTLALADGTLASSGGKVVKNVAGYDLPKLSNGALGTLGVITRAVFRLHPLPHCVQTHSFSSESFAAMQDHIFAIQDSQLAHSALQIRHKLGDRPYADILLEGTNAGIGSQESQLRAILGLQKVENSSERAWNARASLWSSASESSLVAKLGMLPAELAKTLERLNAIAISQNVQSQIVLQAIGITTLCLSGEPARLTEVVQQLRRDLQVHGGSLVILRRPKELVPLDAWGDPGDALSLMRAVKHQLDPQNTLNPGRFVGGI
jgi:glycolate oxidase FAD binding subunit